MRYTLSNMASDNYVQRTEVRQSGIQSFAFVISVCVCALFSIVFAVSSLAVVGEPSGIELDERINPNDAPIASMVRLPGIGISRAEAIVACREDLSKEDSNSRAFRSCYDLQKVRGIGPKTAQSIGEWLKFE